MSSATSARRIAPCHPEPSHTPFAARPPPHLDCARSIRAPSRSWPHAAAPARVPARPGPFGSPHQSPEPAVHMTLSYRFVLGGTKLHEGGHHVPTCPDDRGCARPSP